MHALRTESIVMHLHALNPESRKWRHSALKPIYALHCASARFLSWHADVLGAEVVDSFRLELSLHPCQVAGVGVAVAWRTTRGAGLVVDVAPRHDPVSVRCHRPADPEDEPLVI